MGHLKGVKNCLGEFISWPRESFLADLHIHSSYSRATSPQMRPATLSKVARQKGIKVLGTGDFTHPGYLKELERDLEMEPETGLYVYREDPEGTRFILTAEVSNIFSQGGKGRRIHTVLFAPDIETAKRIQARLARIGNVSSDGRPIFGFPVKDLVRMVMEVSDGRCFVVPAHIWTPWFSLFGAKSGFDSIEECFRDQTEHIYALETGLSSDPQMNWRLSALDNYTLISNSDAHSPAKIAREANVFSCALSYKAIIEAIKDPKKGFLGTIEFFPEEGKYHYDGHRNCGICFTPSQTKQHNGLCPVCGAPLTVGVLHRVEELADRPEGAVSPNALPCVHLIPLEEVIAEALGVRSITARVKKEYQRLISAGYTEMEILLWMDEKELSSLVTQRVYEGIVRMRRGQVEIRPGHDGLYGRISLFPKGQEEKIEKRKQAEKKTRAIQQSLF